MTTNPIFCALDTQDVEAAAKLATNLKGAVSGIKLGLEFFVAQGPAGVKRVAAGVPLFLDLKLHDIPNTVAGAIRSIGPLGVTMTTLHASGGAAMLKGAVEAARHLPRKPWLLGVTMPFQLAAAARLSVGCAYTRGFDASTQLGNGAKEAIDPVGRGVISVSLAYTF